MHLVWRRPALLLRLLTRLPPSQHQHHHHHHHPWNLNLLASLSLATLRPSPSRKIEVDSEEDDDFAPDMKDDSHKNKRVVPPPPRQEGGSLNEAITAKTIRLVVDQGHKIVSREQALKYASEKGLDLVMVDSKADPPVCKVFNYNKEEYKKEQVLKDRKKKQSDRLRLNVVKEIRFSSKTEPKGLELKATRARELLERGHRVKLVANYDPKEAQPELLDRLLPLIGNIAVVEQGPRTESRLAWVICRHIRYGPVKKKPQAQKVLPKIQETEQIQEGAIRVVEDVDDEWGTDVETDFEDEEEQEVSNSRAINAPNKAASEHFPQNLKNVQGNRSQIYKQSLSSPTSQVPLSSAKPSLHGRQLNKQNTDSRVQEQHPYKQQEILKKYPSYGFHERPSGNAPLKPQDRVTRSRGPDDRPQTPFRNSQSSPQANDGSSAPFSPDFRTQLQPPPSHAMPRPLSSRDTTHPMDQAAPVSKFRPIPSAQTGNTQPNSQPGYTPFRSSFPFQTGHQPNIGPQRQSLQSGDQIAHIPSHPDNKPESFTPQQVQHPGHTPKAFKGFSPQDVSSISSDSTRNNQPPRIPIFTPSKRPQTSNQHPPQNLSPGGLPPDTSDTSGQNPRQDQVRKPFRPSKRS